MLWGNLTLYASLWQTLQMDEAATQWDWAFGILYMPIPAFGTVFLRINDKGASTLVCACIWVRLNGEYACHLSPEGYCSDVFYMELRDDKICPCLCSTYWCLFTVVFFHEPQTAMLIIHYLLSRINVVMNCRLMCEFSCDWKRNIA